MGTLKEFQVDYETEHLYHKVTKSFILSGFVAYRTCSSVQMLISLMCSLSG